MIDMSMPLDGIVAGPDDTGIDHIFEWYSSGDEEFRDPLFRPESGLNRDEVERMFVKSGALSLGGARTTSPAVGAAATP